MGIKNRVKDALWTAVTLAIVYFVLSKIGNPLLDLIFTNNTIGKFRKTQVTDVESITISNVPNQDYKEKIEIKISSEDTVRDIFLQLSSVEEGNYGHPSVRCVYFLEVNLKNKEKLSFQILNTSDSVCILKLLTDIETGRRVESFRSDSFFSTSSMLCSFIKEGLSNK